MNVGEQVRAFTAIGQVEDDEPHRAIQNECFEPFRRKVCIIRRRTRRSGRYCKRSA